MITQKRWVILMKEVCPQWSPARVALMWQVLDDNSDGKIGMNGCFITVFTRLSDAPNLSPHMRAKILKSAVLK